ncbi:DUF7935 family protein [Pedobacter montanisoli]|uniref:Uncharacterized protein n=1 Tax=Pedobacter montanisoli TaxID=2923277 RepID=A0ABS9ZW17_9SPHI|nr:hypothetical protein [Pedobacter montanisoli]MCJ0742505.1 hypothetical protein [Pedobacter montanisoli]
MNLNQLILQIVAIALGGSFTVYMGYLLIKGDLQDYFKLKADKNQNKDHQTLLSLRLQAYERLTIFVDRINPANLLIRLHQQGIDMTTLQAVALNEINAEYQHNITQQLYIDATTWNVIRKLKDDTIAMINNAIHGLADDKSGVDMSKRILQHMSNIDENPYELTLSMLRKDVAKMF